MPVAENARFQTLLCQKTLTLSHETVPNTLPDHSRARETLPQLPPRTARRRPPPIPALPRPPSPSLPSGIRTLQPILLPAPILPPPHHPQLTPPPQRIPDAPLQPPLPHQAGEQADGAPERQAEDDARPEEQEAAAEGQDLHRDQHAEQQHAEREDRGRLVRERRGAVEERKQDRCELRAELCEEVPYGTRVGLCVVEGAQAEKGVV